MSGKHSTRVVIIAIVIMFVMPGNAFFFSIDDDGTGVIDTTNDLARENAVALSEEKTKGTPLELITREISVPAGKQYYVYYDSATNTLREMKVPNLAAGLPPIALQAIDFAPSWLKPNLTRKLGSISEIDISIGSRSNPAFGDLDGDGDADLAIGGSAGTIFYYENVDDGYHYYEGYDYFINAVYVQNLTLFSTINIGAFGDPAFADLNDDGRVDMIAGNSMGELRSFERTVVGWAAPVNLGISVVGYSTPSLMDFDGDLDYDLFVGDVNGYISYSENTGTPGSPTWSPLVRIQSGGVDIDVGAYSNPAVGNFFDDDGDPDLVIGAFDGMLDYFRNDGGGIWTDVTATSYLYATNINVGRYSSPALQDMDSNLALDMVIGAETGALLYRENIGTAATPRWLVWSVGFTNTNFPHHPQIDIQFDYYYEDDGDVRLKYRTSTARLTEYAQMIADVANSPDTVRQLDELVFTIAHSSTQGLLHASTYPDVYRNNTEVLYYNDQFIDYANILDFNVGTPEQWSAVEYWVNESGKMNRYVHPKDTYYWYIVHPKVSEEIATYINPSTGTPDPGGLFWRWSVFNTNDTGWPYDVGFQVRYPKEDSPPLLKERLQGVNSMWNLLSYNAPAIYNNSGYDTGARPWNYRDHAVEKVSQWVERTLPLNQDESNGIVGDYVGDGERPIQPVRIQYHHNGNCGELGDLTAAALRSALIPAIEHVSYPEDHCWNHFYERWWHGLDDQWSAGASVVAYNNYVRYWNRDWSAIVAHKGDTSIFDVSPWEHSIVDANGNGYQDRGNVTVVVKDIYGFPVDGAKIGVADWSNYGSWYATGTQWTYTDAEGKAYFFTSESGQGDTYDDGLTIHAGSKYGGGMLNPFYSQRFKICVDPPNLPMYAYDSAFYGVSMAAMPRPHPKATDTAYPGGGSYLLRGFFNVLYGVQHPPNAFGQQDGKTYHDVVFYTGNNLDAFIANASNFKNFLKGEPFEANSTMFNETSGVVSIDVPASGDWYFVLSNQDTIETSKVVNVTVELFDLPSFVPDSSVEPPTNLTIALSGTALENVMLSWDLSLDDPLVGGGEDDVEGYEICYSRVFNQTKQGYALLGTVPSGTSTYNHSNAGNGYIGSEWVGKDYPQDNFFYYVVARDDDWNYANTTEQVAKSIRRLAPGINYASFALTPIDSSIRAVLQTVVFDKVWHYDSKLLDDWETYLVSKLDRSELLRLDNTIGFVINVTEYSYLTVLGYPGEPIQLVLEKGYNMISYPSFTRRTVASVLDGIPYDRVEGYDPLSVPWHTKVYSDTDFMEPGYSYWVKVTAPSVLTVSY